MTARRVKSTKTHIVAGNKMATPDKLAEITAILNKYHDAEPHAYLEAAEIAKLFDAALQEQDIASRLDELKRVNPGKKREADVAKHIYPPKTTAEGFIQGWRFARNKVEAYRSKRIAALQAKQQKGQQ